MRNIKRRYFALAAGLAVAGGVALAAPAASASTVCAPLATANAHAYVSPIHGGQALDAINFGGGGTAAAACTGAQVNDEIKSWTYSQAGQAADFTPVATAGGTYQLVYTPHNMVSTTQPLCISTVLDQQGAYARLRGCAGLGVAVNPGTGTATFVTGANGNQWQDFTFPAAGDGFFQVEAFTEPAKESLNISGFGGNGTQVISWPPLAGDACTTTSTQPCYENMIFELMAAH